MASKVLPCSHPILATTRLARGLIRVPKYTILGGFIYVTMLLYVVAFLLGAAGRRKPAMLIFFGGFLVASASVGLRWFQAGYPPLSNLFEVMLVLAALMFPLSVFCRRFLHAGIETGDMLIGAILLVPVGFVFNAAPRQLPPALQTWLFIPHVFAYVVAYAIMAKAALQAAAQLLARNSTSDPSPASRERATFRLVCMGFPLMTAGLLLGALWGKKAWGNWWNWDPKEMWSLASWLAFVGYFHFRATFGRRRPAVNAVIVLAGFVLILITLLWVNLSSLFSGLHSYAQ